MSRPPNPSNEPVPRNKTLDRFAGIWLRFGHLLGVRPATFLGIFVGALIFSSALTYAIVQSTAAEHKIKQVTSAFCNGRAPLTALQQQNCRLLLDKLLRNPTPEQAKRLREIIKEAP